MGRCATHCVVHLEVNSVVRDDMVPASEGEARSPSVILSVNQRLSACFTVLI